MLVPHIIDNHGWLANHVSRPGLAPTHAFTGGDILHWEGTGHTSAQCPGGHSTLG